MEIITDSDRAFIYPSVSVLGDVDKKRYEERLAAKRRTLCRICEISYDSKKYETCPLCELRKKYNELERELVCEKQNIVTSAANMRAEYKNGDIIRIGKYGGQPVEWMVLDVDNNKVLLISKKILDIKPYNLNNSGVTWESCSLRRYLNTDFLETVFSNDEKSHIVRVKIENCGNPIREVSGGNDTDDKVFCLSYNEVSKYFPLKGESIAFPAEWVILEAKNDNRFIHRRTGCGKWWLRTPGFYENHAMNVDGLGEVDIGGSKVCNGYSTPGIRPALWIKP